MRFVYPAKKLFDTTIFGKRAQTTAIIVLLDRQVHVVYNGLAVMLMDIMLAIMLMGILR